VTYDPDISRSLITSGMQINLQVLLSVKYSLLATDGTSNQAAALV